jgi:hypothetical protein
MYKPTQIPVPAFSRVLHRMMFCRCVSHVTTTNNHCAAKHELNVRQQESRYGIVYGQVAPLKLELKRGGKNV